MKLPTDPALPADVSQMRLRLTSWMRNAAVAVNALVDRTDTPVAGPASVTPSASPFDFSNPTQDGLLVVSGGTVSQIAYGRQGTFTVLGVTAGVIPVKSGDTVRITYTSVPTVAFIPQ